MELLEAFKLGFMQKALLAGCCIALVSALLGVFLVLRRFSLIGDGLAHVSFGAVALGLFVHMYPLAVALPLVMIASLGILKLAEDGTMYGDAAVGMVSAVGIALGVFLASIAGGFNVDLFGYLFGNILAVTRAELGLTVILSAVVLALIVLFYHELFVATFDEEYGRVTGISIRKINRILALLTSFTVVLGIKMVGTMLISSLIIFPAATALQLRRGFRATLGIAAGTAVLSVVAGLGISFQCNYPTGATIVLMNACIFAVAFIIARLRM